MCKILPVSSVISQAGGRDITSMKSNYVIKVYWGGLNLTRISVISQSLGVSCYVKVLPVLAWYHKPEGVISQAGGCENSPPKLEPQVGGGGQVVISSIYLDQTPCWLGIHCPLQYWHLFPGFVKFAYPILFHITRKSFFTQTLLHMRTSSIRRRSSAEAMALRQACWHSMT